MNTSEEVSGQAAQNMNEETPWKGWIRAWALPAAAGILGALILGLCAWTVLSHNAALRRALEYPWWQPIPEAELEAYRAEQEAIAKEAALKKAEAEEAERLERARQAQEERDRQAALEEQAEGEAETGNGTQSNGNTQTEAGTQAETSQQTADKAVTAEETPQQTQGVLPDHIIFVGDSRTVQMKRAVRYDSSVCSFIAQSSMGYEWFRDEAVPAVDSALWSMGGNIAVVVNMGVNDLSDAEQYVKLVNRKAAEWASRGADTYYMSVNPVDDARTQVQNSQIEEFNAYVQDALSEGIEWIDSYDFLTAYGYDSADGLHFTEDTSRDIYRFCLDRLERY